MKRLVALILCLVLVLTMGVGCSNGSSGAEDQEEANGEESMEPVTFKLGHMAPLENNYNLMAEKFKELVEEKTEGRILIEIFPQAQLGYDRDLLEAMQFGNVDFAVNTSAPISNFEPLYGVLDLPYLFDDWDHIESFIKSDVAKDLLAESLDEGLVGLSIMPRGFRSVTNNVRPVNTPEDLEGLKIRVIESPAYVKTFEDLGAVVSAMSWGEVYTALQQGAIDGMENASETLKTERIDEVQKYYSLTEHIAGFACIMASQTTWDGISAEDQEIIAQCAMEAAVAQGHENRESEQSYRDALTEAGMVINSLDKSLFSKLATSAYDWFEGENGSDYVDRIKGLK